MISLSGADVFNQSKTKMHQKNRLTAQRHNGNSAPIDDFRLKKLLHGTQNSSIKSSVMCNRNDAAHRFSLNRMLISFGWICAVQIVLRFTV